MFFLLIFSIYTKRINVRYCWLGKKTKLMWQICFKKKISWEILIFWVEVGKDVEVLSVNCFQSPTLKIHDKIVSLVHQIIDFIPDFICCCTNLTCGSVKWAYENLSRLNKFLVLVLLSPVNASMHVVIHMSLQSLSFVSLAKATCNV